MPQTPLFQTEYPVVNANPTNFAIIRNCGFGDYVQLVTSTGIGAVVGFAVGMLQPAYSSAPTSAFFCPAYACRGP